MLTLGHQYEPNKFPNIVSACLFFPGWMMRPNKGGRGRSSELERTMKNPVRFLDNLWDTAKVRDFVR